jgi:hypothetical protein
MESRVVLGKHSAEAGGSPCVVYSVTLDGNRRERVLENLYISVLASLCEANFVLFVEHTTNSREIHTRLANSLLTAGVPFQSATLYRSEFQTHKKGIHRRGRPTFEITLSTNRRTHLEILFREGDLFSNFVRWILDAPKTPFPLDTLRVLNLGGERLPTELGEALRAHPAVVELREFHGPWIWTSSLGQKLVLEAVQQACQSLGIPLMPNLSDPKPRPSRGG